MKKAYCFIKGNHYKNFRIEREEDENFLPIEKNFNTKEELVDFAIALSNNYSVPIQFYK